jgi:hypothetical protein
MTLQNFSQNICTEHTENQDMDYSRVSQTLLHADPFWFPKITTDPQILAHINCVQMTGTQN